MIWGYGTTSSRRRTPGSSKSASNRAPLWPSGSRMPVEKASARKLIAPSALKFSESYKTPKQMSAEDIVSVKQAFAKAAARAECAGYAAT